MADSPGTVLKITDEEGGEWIDINIHSLQMPGGAEWDEVNGWRNNTPSPLLELGPKRKVYKRD